MIGSTKLHAETRAKLFLAGIFVLLIIFHIPSVTAQESDTEGGPRFSHELHVQEMEMFCDTCHMVPSEEDPEASMIPQPEVCTDCHDEEKQIERSQRTHLNLIDRHELHQDSEIECRTCHEGIADDDGSEPLMDGTFMPDPALCEDCHGKRDVVADMNDDCAECHKPGTYDKQLEPYTHVAGWTRFHGSHSWFSPDGNHGKDCSTCHSDQSCVDCHTTTEPKDHTRFFKTRGHGVVATGFSDRCLTCHRQDSCLSCHQETAPRNHRREWLQKGHCVSCHIGTNSSVDSNCKTCHRTPIHLEN